MTQRRATGRRNTLEKHQPEVIADLAMAMRPVEVAAKYKVARSTVTRFMERNQAAIEALLAERRRKTSDYAIANVVNRIEALDERWRLMRRLVGARREAGEALLAADHEDLEAGVETGLMRRIIRYIPSGDGLERRVEYTLDRDLLAELRATERAAAEQLSQLPKPGDINVNAGEGSRVLIVTSEPELGF